MSALCAAEVTWCQRVSRVSSGIIIECREVGDVRFFETARAVDFLSYIL